MLVLLDVPILSDTIEIKSSLIVLPPYIISKYYILSCFLVCKN
nr:MAG TPA: hypothetical protein [Caudoviricetes sp.]